MYCILSVHSATSPYEALFSLNLQKFRLRGRPYMMLHDFGVKFAPHLLLSRLVTKIRPSFKNDTTNYDPSLPQVYELRIESRCLSLKLNTYCPYYFTNTTHHRK
jgi:hypothetical protein